MASSSCCYEMHSPYESRFKCALVLDSEAYGATKALLSSTNSSPNLPSHDQSPLEALVMIINAVDYFCISVDDAGRTDLYQVYTEQSQESTRFRVSTFECYDSAFSKFSEILSSMGINSEHHDDILRDGLGDCEYMVPIGEAPSYMRYKVIHITVRVHSSVWRFSHKQCLDAWATSNIAMAPGCRKEVEEQVKVFIDKRCCICLEEFNKEESDEFLAIVPCYHVFHDKCIFQCLYRSSYCPLCRSDIKFLVPLPPHKI